MRRESGEVRRGDTEGSRPCSLCLPTLWAGLQGRRCSEPPQTDSRRVHRRRSQDCHSRCCTFVYEIASNRGGRHDPNEVDPNEMDAAAAVANVSWILAEMIRFAQKGAVDLGEAKQLVDSLTERKYPLIERVEGRLYFHKKKRSGVDVALVALATRHPARMSRQELIETVRRNGFKEHNARTAVNRIARLVDDDGGGRLRLLAPGRQKADEIIREARS